MLPTVVRVRFTRFSRQSGKFVHSVGYWNADFAGVGANQLNDGRKLETLSDFRRDPPFDKRTAKSSPGFKC